MRSITSTVLDTIHLLAFLAVIFLLFILVIAREEPAWTDFALQSGVVLAASVVLARLVSWTMRRPHR